MSLEFEGLIYVQYLDHVVYSRSIPETMQPQIREAIGWLIYECDKYVILAWDKDAMPPTLKGGDPKASGLVLLKSAILKMKKLGIRNINCRLHIDDNRIGAKKSEKFGTPTIGEKIS